MSLDLILVIVAELLAAGIGVHRKIRTGSFFWWSRGKGDRDA
jgi:hypothetical protein